MHLNQEGVDPLSVIDGDLFSRAVAPRGDRPGLSRGYTIGITIFINADGDFGLFENGLRQNVIFLYHLFKAAPNCRGVYLLNHGDGEVGALPDGLGIAREDIVRTSALPTAPDFILTIGAAIDRPTTLALRAQGTRFICYKGGNGAIIAMEALIARPPRADAERYFDVDLVDAIWMTPQHVNTYSGWCRTLYRCSVEEVPQIWSPLFVDSRPPEIRARFGYRAGTETWRVGVLDPNVTVMKTSHLPMLVCDAAYRCDPDAFSAFYISNALQYREDPHFASFTMRLHAARAGLMTLEPRFVSADFLANHCDAIVTHQWENALNYVYYETLYGGYPLIHNSPFLKDFGYYYPDFDPFAGGAALLFARRVHDDRLDAYRRHNQPLFAELSPTAPTNIALHEALLEKLVALY